MAREMVRRGRLLWVILCALGMIPVAGCGKGSKRVPVSGTVTLDGKPLENGVLSFAPDESKGNSSSINCSAPVQSGKYTLNAVSKSDSSSGIPVGWYKVTLITDVPGQAEAKADRKPASVDNKTPIFVEVVADAAPGAYDIKFSKPSSPPLTARRR